MLEESNTVQCPSVAYQLAGAKKIQQDLASPQTLERYLDDKNDIQLARDCFAGPVLFSFVLFISSFQNSSVTG